MRVRQRVWNGAHVLRSDVRSRASLATTASIKSAPSNAIRTSASARPLTQPMVSTNLRCVVTYGLG
jgi:hypothetical protein